MLCIIRAHEVQELGFHKHFDPSVITERTLTNIRPNRRVTSAILAHEGQYRPDSLAHPKSPKLDSSTKKPFSFEEVDSPPPPSNQEGQTSECEIDIPSGTISLHYQLVMILCSYYCI